MAPPEAARLKESGIFAAPAPIANTVIVPRA
jgi:hypothetical protein